MKLIAVSYTAIIVFVDVICLLNAAYGFCVVRRKLRPKGILSIRTMDKLYIVF